MATHKAQTKMPITEHQGKLCMVRDKRGGLMKLTLARNGPESKELFLQHYPTLERTSIASWEVAEEKGYFVDYIQVGERP